ncbi:MAG: hypothetical protein SFY66_27100 [Oculatellaceae cyanobacterium bins.114]|nr:hypothetical protein [Oculatellaceae cyanobacterium bins.114]
MTYTILFLIELDAGFLNTIQPLLRVTLHKWLKNLSQSDRSRLCICPDPPF